MPLLCSVLGFRAQAILLDVGDREDVGVADWGMATEQTALRQRAEAAGERKVLVMVHGLPPEEQDAAFAQELPQGGDGGASQLFAGAQVEANDLRASAPR